jgi:hypothetical protein
VTDRAATPWDEAEEDLTSALCRADQDAGNWLWSPREGMSYRAVAAVALTALRDAGYSLAGPGQLVDADSVPMTSSRAAGGGGAGGTAYSPRRASS